MYACNRILIYYDGIELQFEGPPGIPQFKGKKKGRIYLTTHQGNWTGEAKFKMYFTHGGAIEFGQAMLKAASLDNSVYMTEAPPPYPGINPDMAPYPPMANGHDSKAQEAAASAYYNPANPHYMYASAPPPPSAPAYPGSDPPPAYDQANKKYD
nr:hypothetical protein BaRGS_014025 [Batillaria attramentaria]